MTSLIWRRLDHPGMEWCRLADADGRHQLSGSVVVQHEGTPCSLEYSVIAGPDWTTVAAAVSGFIGDRKVTAVITRGVAGRWRHGEIERPELDACLDVDLAFSPCTNTLPIRRLALPVGGSAAVSAAWLRFPGFDLHRLEQTYARLGESTYRYESGGGAFIADLEVGSEGLVRRYSTFWEAV